MMRCEPCSCGSVIIADAGDYGASVASHVRTSEHRLWRAERVAAQGLEAEAILPGPPPYASPLHWTTVDTACVDLSASTLDASSDEGAT